MRIIFQIHPIGAVIHFAADTNVESSMIDPGQFFNNDVADGIILLDVMREFGCNRMICSSTAAIYGEPRYNPVDENHSKLPVNPHGESKLMFEKILDWYHKAYGLKFNVLRYFNAAGASKKSGEAKRIVSLLIPLIIPVLLGQKERLQIFGNDYPVKDGTCIRDYIHVLNLAEAHIQALKNLDKHPPRWQVQPRQWTGVF